MGYRQFYEQVLISYGGAAGLMGWGRGGASFWGGGWWGRGGFGLVDPEVDGVYFVVFNPGAAEPFDGAYGAAGL